MMSTIPRISNRLITPLLSTSDAQISQAVAGGGTLRTISTARSRSYRLTTPFLSRSPFVQTTVVVGVVVRVNVGVDVRVGVYVGVRVGVRVGVNVGVRVGVLVGVKVGVLVGVIPVISMQTGTQTTGSSGSLLVNTT